MRLTNTAPIDATDALAQRLKSAEAQIAELQRLSGSLEGSAFTPALTGLTMGTGGSPSNTAAYTYSGGILVASGRIVFGNSGQTFPSGSSRIALPAGFTSAVVSATDHIVGIVVYRDVDAAAAYRGPISLATSGLVRPLLDNVSGTYPLLTSPSSTVPFTWAAGDSVTWQYAMQAVRS